ncbi:hypothetical protein BJ165DRAFT_1139131 [Panaeolus papilionaceus]|nr:hypothetical protein BJ165DRAFT_1139131 [Panaeolus papilionaceus]
MVTLFGCLPSSVRSGHVRLITSSPSHQGLFQKETCSISYTFIYYRCSWNFFFLFFLITYYISVRPGFVLLNAWPFCFYISSFCGCHFLFSFFFFHISYLHRSLSSSTSLSNNYNPNSVDRYIAFHK